MYIEQIPTCMGPCSPLLQAIRKFPFPPTNLDLPKGLADLDISQEFS